MNKHERLQKYMEKGTKNSGETLELFEILAGGPLTFASLVKSHRECEKLSQKDLAEKISVSKQALSRIENDTLLPSIKTTIKLAQAFKMSAASFLKLRFQEEINREVKKFGLRKHFQIDVREAV